MVNKNTVSKVAKLLIQSQFKISPLQFFTMFPFSAAASIVDLFIYVFVFTLCLGVFPFFSWGGGCFSPFFTFHILWNSALSFPPCDMEYDASETTVRFKSKMGGVGVILNYWTQGETWAMDMASDFPPLHFFLCLCQLGGFLSVVRTMRGWCRLSEGDVLYSDLVQMHSIMIMFCYLYAPPAPVPLLWKSERRKQLQKLLPFSQVLYLLLLLCSPIIQIEKSLHLCAVLHSQQVCSGNRQNAHTIRENIRVQLSCLSIHIDTHNLPTLHTSLHIDTSPNVDIISWHTLSLSRTHTRTHTHSV